MLWLLIGIAVVALFLFWAARQNKKHPGDTPYEGGTSQNIGVGGGEDGGGGG